MTFQADDDTRGNFFHAGQIIERPTSNFRMTSKAWFFSLKKTYFRLFWTTTFLKLKNISLEKVKLFRNLSFPRDEETKILPNSQNSNKKIISSKSTFSPKWQQNFLKDVVYSRWKNGPTVQHFSAFNSCHKSLLLRRNSPHLYKISLLF